MSDPPGGAVVLLTPETWRRVAEVVAAPGVQEGAPTAFRMAAARSAFVTPVRRFAGP